MSGKTRSRSATACPITTDGLIVRIGSGLQAVARLALVCLLASFSAYAAGSDSAPFDCNADHCGLLVDGAYPNLVIGRLDHVDTAVDMARAFHWARAHGYWKALPALTEP